MVQKALTNGTSSSSSSCLTSVLILRGETFLGDDGSFLTGDLGLCTGLLIGEVSMGSDLTGTDSTLIVIGGFLGFSSPDLLSSFGLSELDFDNPSLCFDDDDEEPSFDLDDDEDECSFDFELELGCLEEEEELSFGFDEDRSFDEDLCLSLSRCSEEPELGFELLLEPSLCLDDELDELDLECSLCLEDEESRCLSDDSRCLSDEE
jgi:hypothetical protein